MAPGLHAIGRHASCAISLDDPKVSRRHAHIIVTDDEAFVEDLGSRRGVLVDGRRVDGCRRLFDRSRLPIGDQVLTLVNIDSPRAPALAAREMSPYDELACRVDSLRVVGAFNAVPGNEKGGPARAAAAVARWGARRQGSKATTET